MLITYNRLCGAPHNLFVVMIVFLSESLAIAVADRVKQTTTRQSTMLSVFIRANIAIPPYS